MNDKDFEKIMDKWVSHEINGAPDIKPIEEVYEKVRAKQKKSIYLTFSRPIRWATVGVAVAAVILFAILNPQLFRPSNEATGIGLRKGIIHKKGAIRNGKSGAPGREQKKGAEKDQVGFSQLKFQCQKRAAQSIEEVDIQYQQDAKVNLSSDDNYRLLFQLNQERFVYMYQLDTKKKLTKLFPNENYSAAQNPLQAGQIYYLPQPPNWFYLDNGKAEETIFIVASSQPKGELDNLYDQYIQVKNDKGKKEILQKVISEFESIKTSPGGEANIYEFNFNNQR